MKSDIDLAAAPAHASSPRAADSFSGPVFIVGMPRSGTKLLRTLLNRHSLIGIPEFESHFIPYYAQEDRDWRALQAPEEFRRFYQHIGASNFCRRLGRDVPDCEAWRQAVEEWSCAGVMEALFRLYAAGRGKPIWGDKTPQYLTQLPLLARLYPAGRFIHIVRDPRDYCASVQKAWGKHPYRSAQRWADEVARCRADGAALGEQRFLEVRYEDLLTDTEAVMRRISEFLGVPFEACTTVPDKAAENLGAARGSTSIVRDNAYKWRRGQDRRAVARIERICAEELRRSGYPASYSGPSVRLGRVRRGFYQAADALHVVRHTLAEEPKFGDALLSLRDKLLYRGP